jgi:hypothetical protein
MSETKFTPGPWETPYRNFSEVRAQNGALVAVCKPLDGLVNLQANARLIAAAPQMYEALEKAKKRIDYFVWANDAPFDVKLQEAIDAVLKAARGEQ